jgi:hypothetical protein
MFISPPQGVGRSRPRGHEHLDALQPDVPVGERLRALGFSAVGWLAGYLISLVSWILFFTVGHIVPEKPASTGVMWAAAIYGVVFAVIGAMVGASFSRRNAIGIGAAIALTIGAVSLWSWYSTPHAEHWAEAISLFLMAPAAQFGSLAQRLTD